MLLNNVSWQAYWTVLAIISAGYYLTVYLLYFRNDFKVSFPHGGVQSSEETTSTSVPPFSPPDDLPDQTSTLYEGKDEDDETVSEDLLFNACSDEALAFIEEAGEKEMVRPEIMYGLERIARKYPSLSTAFREDLKLLTQTTCKEFCSVHLSDEDLIHVWMKG